MSAPLRSFSCTFSRWRKLREVHKLVFGHACQSVNRTFTNSQKVWDKTTAIKGLTFETYRDTQRLEYEYAKNSIIVRCEYSDLAKVLTAMRHKYGEFIEAFYYQKTRGLSSVLVHFKDTPCDTLTVNKKSLPHVNTVDKLLLDKVRIHQQETFDIDELKQCTDVSKQILFLYDKVKIQNVTLKQYYVIGNLIKDIVYKRYNPILVGFFGSASCGIATDNNSDLDIALILEKHHDTKSILRYINKKIRDIRKKALLFSDVHRIETARVPIIKFVHSDTGISCDVSCNSLAGMMMAEMLCWLNHYEPMFYPLVITIKQWAKEHRLAKSGTGSHFTNHMLTMLVISFLQHKQLLPALQMAYMDKNVLTSNHMEDLLTTWEKLKLKHPTKTVVSKFFVEKRGDIGTLLLEFFQFYSKLPFDECELNILTGKILKRPHVDDIYMPNPYEYQHNMCRNVRSVYVEKFQYLCQQSAKILRESYDKKSDERPWGIMCVLQQEIMKKHLKHALFDLDSLFSSDDQNVDEVIFEIEEPRKDDSSNMRTSYNSDSEHTTLNKSIKSQTMIEGLNSDSNSDGWGTHESQVFLQSRNFNQSTTKSTALRDNTNGNKNKRRKAKKKKS